MSTANAFTDALLSTGRGPEIPEIDDIFAFLVGSWSLDAHLHDRDGQTQQLRGELHVVWVLEGRAQQDLFIYPRRSERVPGMRRPNDRYATTIRAYDASNRVWHVEFINPAAPETSARLTARRTAGEIIMEGELANRAPVRWRYVDITPKSFRYNAERLWAEDETWGVYLELFGRR